MLASSPSCERSRRPSGRPRIGPIQEPPGLTPPRAHPRSATSGIARHRADLAAPRASGTPVSEVVSDSTSHVGRRLTVLRRAPTMATKTKDPRRRSRELVGYASVSHRSKSPGTAVQARRRQAAHRGRGAMEVLVIGRGAPSTASAQRRTPKVPRWPRSANRPVTNTPGLVPSGHPPSAVSSWQVRSGTRR
jgi:hypothetical protein